MSARPAIRPLRLSCRAWLVVALAAAPVASATRSDAVVMPAGHASGASRAAIIVAVDACIPLLDAERDVGFARITRLCPQLWPALEASGMAAALPPDFTRGRNELSVSGLRALRRALEAPGAAPLRRPPPDTGALSELVRASQATTAAGGGAWARFNRWLRSIVEGAEPRADAPGPLSRFADLTLPQRFWSVLGYAAVAALLLFAAWIVRAELRAAGVLARAQVGRHSAAHVESSLAEGWPAVLATVPALERPAWLLRRLAETLQRLGRLPASGHLTPRELVRVARLDDPREREPLRAIAEAAERVRFAATPPAAPALEPAVEAAAALLRRLGHTAPPRGDAGRA